MTNKELFNAAYDENAMAQDLLAHFFHCTETTPEQSARVLDHLNKALCAWQEFHNRTCGHEPAKHG